MVAASARVTALFGSSVLCMGRTASLHFIATCTPDTDPGLSLQLIGATWGVTVHASLFDHCYSSVATAALSGRKTLGATEMIPFARTVLAASLLGAGLTGCNDVLEQATVTISYASQASIQPSNEQALLRFGRMRIEESFRRFSAKNGYECRPHIKRVEEIRCRGPGDLHLIFQPSLNKPEFTARFSWANVGGRTHEEFTSQVRRFQREFGAQVGEQQLQLQKGT